MKLSEFIQTAQNLAGDSDPELILYNRPADVELLLRPDSDIFDYEITRGIDQLVIEFD